MGKVVQIRVPDGDFYGRIHVAARDGGFEVAHESASGNSWGGFRMFVCAEEAIAAAYRVNQVEHDGECEIYINPDALAAVGW